MSFAREWNACQGIFHMTRVLEYSLRDLPHINGTQVEARKSVLASKQFLVQVLMCLVNVYVKSRNVIKLFTLPCKTNNMLADNITYLNVLAGLYVSPYQE